MEYFIVQDKPIVAREQPSPTSNIINAYDIGTKIPIVSFNAGWYTTSSKTYIFRTKNLIPYSKWEKQQKEKLGPPELIRSLRKVGGEIEVGDTVVFNRDGVENERDNTIVDSRYFVEKVPFTVTRVEGSSVVISNSSLNLEFTVIASSLEITESSTLDQTEVTKQSITNSIESQYNALTNQNVDLSIGNLDVKSLRSIYGMPYQFLPIADNRIDGSMKTRSLGRKYAEKIAARAPILVMQAGRADFLRGFDKETKDATLTEILTKSAAHLATGSVLEQMVNTPSMYYSFKVLPAQYYGAVQQMCFAMANLLGLGNYDLELSDNYTHSLSDPGFDWSQANATKWFGYNAGAVGFYISSDAQINESFNNNTMPSSLLQKMNEFGRMGSELQFLLGGVSNYTGFDLDAIADGNLTQEGLILKGNTNGTGGLIDSIIDNVQTLMVGGRMIFPEMWADSQFMRSYNVTIKLDSPDADNLSIFLNILVPLAHILAFVVPRSVGSNNYISPFLVRAYYKSMFHIDMGIITGCSIQKGDTGAWNQAGLPTQITIQLTIKDMYNVMSLSTGLGNNSIIGNPGQLDYIANLCGVNIDEPELFGKAFNLWLRLINPFTNVPARLRLMWQGLQADLHQRMINMIRDRIG